MTMERFLRRLIGLVVAVVLVACIMIFLMALSTQYGNRIGAQTDAVKQGISKLIGIQTEAEKAQMQLLKLAEAGDGMAQYQLARAYDKQRQFSKSIVLYQKLANQGLAIPQMRLGVMYMEGMGTAQDTNQALYWLNKAANQGDVTAQQYLGVVYFGQIPNAPLDLEMAIKWIQTAANNLGAGEAQDMLARLYASGTGVPQDLDLALAWAQKAKASGYAKAEETIRITRELQLQKGDKNGK